MVEMQRDKCGKRIVRDREGKQGTAGNKQGEWERTRWGRKGDRELEDKGGGEGTGKPHIMKGSSQNPTKL